jgi:hypothetical protein
MAFLQRFLVRAGNIEARPERPGDSAMQGGNLSSELG